MDYEMALHGLRRRKNKQLRVTSLVVVGDEVEVTLRCR